MKHVPDVLLQNTKASSTLCSYFVDGEWEENVAIYSGLQSTSEFIIYNYFPIEYAVVID